MFLKHQDERKAQQGHLMGTNVLILTLMRIKRFIKVSAESMMLDVYLIY